MQEIIQNIFVYVLLIAVFREMISQEGFREIFRFASGLILILMFLSPVISIISGSDSWYEKIEGRMMNLEQMQTREQLKLSDGIFKKRILAECKREMKRKIKKEIALEKEKEKNIHILLQCEDGGVIKVKELFVELYASDGNAEQKRGKEKTIHISRIEISNLKKRNEEKNVRREDAGTRQLKKKLCKIFQCQPEEVKVWRMDGKSGTCG